MTYFTNQGVEFRPGALKVKPSPTPSQRERAMRISRDRLLGTSQKRGANRFRSIGNCVFYGASLGFVGLLARTQKVLDRGSGFASLTLFEFTYPVRDRGHHIASGLTRGVAGGLCLDRLSFTAFGTFDDFYFFLRHILWTRSLDF